MVTKSLKQSSDSTWQTVFGTLPSKLISVISIQSGNAMPSLVRESGSPALKAGNSEFLMRGHLELFQTIISYILNYFFHFKLLFIYIFRFFYLLMLKIIFLKKLNYFNIFLNKNNYYYTFIYTLDFLN
jgi:hypothetical protein